MGVVSDELDALLLRATAAKVDAKRNTRIVLYAEGVKSKLQQASYALSEVTLLAPQSDHTATTTVVKHFDISTRVGFYCDSFWAFLYSSLDITAHVINNALQLGMQERGVSFKEIAKKLDATHSGTPLQKAVKACTSSQCFKNLDKYRNCSTHRRDIYMEESISMVKGTKGYVTVTGSQPQVTRTICDDPLVLKPKTNQKRAVPDYLVKTRGQIETHVEKIVKCIEPTT